MDIYISKLPKTRDKLKKDKEHLELNKKSEFIKIMFAKAGIRPKKFYDEILCPKIQENGIFCKKKFNKLIVKNGKYVPKSYPLFRKYLETKNILNIDLISRRELIDHLMLYVMAIDRIWINKIQKIDLEILKLQKMIDSDKGEPRDFTEETLREYIEHLEKYGLKIE